MVEKNLFVFLLLGVSFLCFAQNPSGPYFGQEPPGATPEVFAPGFISVDGRFEQNAAFTPDGKEFYFSTTDNNWGAFRLYYTKEIDDEWTDPKLADTILGFYDNTEPFVTSDGQRLFFVSPRPSAPPWNTDIWMCEREDSSWSTPVKIEDPVSSTNREWHPTVSLDSTIYFQSLHRDGGYGYSDIYKAELDASGEYTIVENLGEVINSDSGDGEATIAPDESFLIFSSYRPGYGESDIYISFNDNGAWSEPINLGPPINTSEAEYGMALSPDGKYLFFTRRETWYTSEDSDIWWVSTSFIDSIKSGISIGDPPQFELKQNYPNPFSSSTIISYSISTPALVELNIYDILGKKVRTLVKGYEESGRYEIPFDAENLSAGVYFYKLSVDGVKSDKKKMLLLK